MKKFLLLTLAGVLCVAAAQAGVDYVAVPDVATTYTAITGEFEIGGSGLVATVVYDDGSDQLPLSPTSFFLSADYVSGMSFTGGTFELTDDSGVLLSGNVISVEFGEALGYLVGSGSAVVTQSGIDGFPEGPSEIISLTFNLDPEFTDFTQNYSGLTKVNLGVPEPATMFLLGLGGLLLRKRK